MGSKSSRLWFPKCRYVCCKYCKSNDVVISQDYGVAALCLGKGAHLLNPKGFYIQKKI